MLSCMSKKSSRLWILCVAVACLLENTAAKESIAVTCVEGCVGGDGDAGAPLKEKIIGKENTNLTLLFTIVAENNYFALLVKYNITSEITITPFKINAEKIKNKRLYVLSNKPTHDGETFTFKITLSKLALKPDDGSYFTYVQTGVSGSFPEAKLKLEVIAVPQFVEPPNQKYTIEENTKKSVSFTIRGNPAPKEVTAKIGDVDVTVHDTTTPRAANSTPTYRFHYKVEIVMKRKQCGDSLLVEVVAENGKKASVISELVLKFEPDVVQNVKASRIENALQVKWHPLVYGKCDVLYHVKFLNNNSLHAEIFRTPDLKMELKNPLGNMTISVNAEVNGKGGKYSKKITIAATEKPEVPSGKKTDDKDGSMTTIIGASVAGAILIVVIIIAVLLLMKRKKKQNRDPEYHRDMEPIAYQAANHAENDYTYIDNLVAPKKQPQQQTIYAELGPGGGNIGRKPLPQQSNYAEVKTEGIHYPDLQQSSPRNPPEYGIASRNRPQQGQQNTYDEVSMDDYESSVVV